MIQKIYSSFHLKNGKHLISDFIIYWKLRKLGGFETLHELFDPDEQKKDDEKSFDDYTVTSEQ